VQPDAPPSEPEEQARPADPPVKEANPIEEARRRLKQQILSTKRKFWLKVAAFAVLPALLAIAYEGFVSVPLYEARSVVIVAKASNTGDSSFNGILGAVGASGGSNINEAFMAHEYVLSQTLLDDLENDMSLVSRFSSDEIDPLRRLWDLRLFGIDQRTQFQRYVRSSVNVQTGMMTLYVRAPSREESELISQSILNRIEKRVNLLSDNLFQQQVLQAQAGVEDAQNYLIETQGELTRLQIESGEADPQTRVAGIYESIAALQADLLDIETQIESERIAGRAESFETERLNALRIGLEARIDLMRRQLVEVDRAEQDRPLNALLLDYQRAELEMEIGQEALSIALTSLASAREQAALGRSQFQVVVPPSVGDIPWRPRPVASGFAVFLIGLSALSIVSLFRR
ncbi:MAG: hypothetical protein AAFQ66_23070, partial [Pseudomonadota bacterium]